jgi:hypothetical protein
MLFAAAYEAAFVAAEPEVATTSLDAATSLLCAVAVGFVVTLLAAAKRAGVSVVSTPEPEVTR